MTKTLKLIFVLSLLIVQTSFGQGLGSTTLSSNSIEECDKINYIPKSSKPDLATMLTGVKYAIITQRPNMNGKLPVYSALIDYLKGMGFESIKYFDENQDQATNPCEKIHVNIAFKYDLDKFYNITLAFWNLATGYEWEFSTNKTVSDGLYSDSKNNGVSRFFNLSP